MHDWARAGDFEKKILLDGEPHPAGQKLNAKSKGLTINGAAYPWSALQVEAVEFLKKQFKRKSWFEIDRLRVRSNDGKSSMIDGFGYQNGAKLIDFVAQRLRPQIRPAIGSSRGIKEKLSGFRAADAL